MGPRELKLASSSSSRVNVPLVLDAPTVNTHGAFPGAVIPPHCLCPFGVLTCIASRRDNHDALIDQRFCRQGQRIGP